MVRLLCSYTVANVSLREIYTVDIDIPFLKILLSTEGVPSRKSSGTTVIGIGLMLSLQFLLEMISKYCY